MMSQDQKRTVLIVDDDPINVMVLSDVLERDYVVRSTTNPEEALALALQEPQPDCILLDVVMPSLDGYEICSQLKKRSETQAIPVIFITSRTETEDEALGFEIGAVDYIAKPFSPPLVMSRVTNHIVLYQQKLELAKLNAQKNHFLGIAAHDLRNPLMSISGFSELLANPAMGELTAKQKRYLDAINDSCEVMRTLIDDLLDVSLIESGQFELNLAETDIAELVNGVVFMYEQQALAKQISLKVMLSGNLPNALMLDKPKIEQVIGNLISNAIKYSHSDTRIDVSVAVESGQLVIEVRDQGQGIPAHELPSLFHPFAKTSVRSTAGEKSIGLGLAIVQRIVKGHGGEISIASEVGVGTTFRVEIPA